MKNVSLAQTTNHRDKRVDAVTAVLKHAISVNSNTSVFQLSLLASGLRDVSRD